ncbi:MAG: Mov34/MPN/PAD-1 family protein [Chloroflexi bacterium]|nr:Mov34/MPN/PAD-1 family protein [Chloroflexota bacterium]
MANSTYRVIISDKAYRGILAETFENIGTETGGIFLGKYERGVWYIIENLDPGPNSIFEPAYFEYDTPYVNHLANKIARFYKTGLELIGLWHRHPGSFSSFSATDDSTNIKYANSHDYGAISALVNLDPDFRLTVYHVSSPLRPNSIT